jgi:hypothetical protein
MNIAHRRLVAQKDKLNSRIDDLLRERVADQHDAASIALEELAQQAYEDAVDTLDSECARRARIEYVVSGDEFLAESQASMIRSGDPSAILLGAALDAAKGRMPQQVNTVHTFGCREDGLIFGRTSTQAIGGSFEAFQSTIGEALDRAALMQARKKILADGASKDLATALAPRLLDGMRPALRAIIRRSFPVDDASEKGRTFCTHVDDVRGRLARLETVIFCADNEPRHVLPGLAASARMAQLAIEAHNERPDAASISAFFLSIGY